MGGVSDLGSRSRSATACLEPLCKTFGVAMRSWPRTTRSAAVRQLVARVAQTRTGPDPQWLVLGRHYQATR